MFVGRRTTEMGGPVFNQPVEGNDDGIKNYAVRGLSSSGVGMWGSSYSGAAVIGMS
jgi:hypothetical protein